MAARAAAPKDLGEMLWRADLLEAVLEAIGRGTGGRTVSETIDARGLNPGIGGVCELVDLANRMYRRLAADTLRLIRQVDVLRIPEGERVRFVRSLAVAHAKLEKLLSDEADGEAWLRRQLEGLDGGGA